MIIYIDMDDVLCDFTGAKNKALTENPAISFPQSQYGFYQKLKAIEGAIESVQYFIESPRYIPYILTAPSIKNPLSYTEKRVWVEENIGLNFVEHLIICSNKSLLRGDLLIDDNSSGRGQENFLGSFIHFGSEKYPNWKAVMTEFENIA